MARAIWSGTLQLGLLTIPVKLYTAQRDASVSFSNLCPEGHKLTYKKWCPICNKEVHSSEIKKGFQISKNQFVIFTQEEIEALKQKAEKSIEVLGFTDISATDPVMFNKTYYIAPKEEIFAKPFYLLFDIMSETRKVAVVKFTFRNKEHLAILRPLKTLFALTLLYTAESIVKEEQILPEKPKVSVSEQEKELGKQLIENMNIDFHELWAEFKDKFKEKIMEIVEKKLQGEEITVEIKEKKEEAVDLQEALMKTIQITAKK